MGEQRENELWERKVDNVLIDLSGYSTERRINTFQNIRNMHESLTFM